MEKETYGVLLIIGFVLVVAVGFMYYGASAGKASMFAKDVTDTVKCVFKNSEKVEKCIAERYGNSCDGVGSCEMKVRAKYGSHTNVGACGGSCGIRIEGKYKTCEFNCGPAPVEFKGYAVGDTFELKANKAMDVSFKETRRPVNLFFKFPESSLYVNEYSPGYMSGGFVYHIPVDDVLVVLRLMEFIQSEDGVYRYFKFRVESIGKPPKSSVWPSFSEPAVGFTIQGFRPNPSDAKVPTGSVIGLKCDRLCYIFGMFDNGAGYEVKALNPGEIGKFIAHVGENKFKVFEWGRYDKSEIFVVYGTLPALHELPTQRTQESMVPTGG